MNHWAPAVRTMAWPITVWLVICATPLPTGGVDLLFNHNFRRLLCRVRQKFLDEGFSSLFFLVGNVEKQEVGTNHNHDLF